MPFFVKTLLMNLAGRIIEKKLTEGDVESNVDEIISHIMKKILEKDELIQKLESKVETLERALGNALENRVDSALKDLKDKTPDSIDPILDWLGIKVKDLIQYGEDTLVKETKDAIDNALDRKPGTGEPSGTIESHTVTTPETKPETKNDPKESKTSPDYSFLSQAAQDALNEIKGKHNPNNEEGD